MTTVSIRSDSSGAIARLRRVGAKSRSLPLRQAGMIVKNSVMTNFVLGGSPRKWAPRKVDVPWPILRKSSDGLMMSFYVEVLANAVAIGTRKIHAAVHNFGYPPRGIPMRKYLFARKEDIDIIGELFRRHLRS